MIKRFLLGVMIFIFAGMNVFAEEKENAALNAELIRVQNMINSRAESVLKLGTPIGQSATIDGYIFTVESMYMDDEVYYVVSSLKKVDGTSFEASEKMDLWSIEVVDKYADELCWYDCDQCSVAGSSDKKLYFLSRGAGTEEWFGNNEWHIVADTLVKCFSMEEQCTIDLTGYLQKHKEAQTKENPQWLGINDYLKQIKEEDMEEYNALKKRFADMPKNCLAEGNLNMNLIEGNSQYQLENVGFVDGKLHLLVKKPAATLFDENITIKFKDAEGNDYYSIERWDQEAEDMASGSEEKYEIFDIADLKTLKQYQCYLEIYGADKIAEGSWEVTVQVPNDKNSIKKQPNELITYANQQQAKLNTLILRPSSVMLQLSHIGNWDDQAELPVVLQMKDGSKINLLYDYSSVENKEEDILYLIPTGLISINQVKGVLVGNKMIKMN